MLKSQIFDFCKFANIIGTPALHWNEATWIIDGSNELLVDFLFALVLFLDSTQPRPFKNPKQVFFFVNPMAAPNEAQARNAAAAICLFIRMQGWCSSFELIFRFRFVTNKQTSVPSG